MLSRCLLVMVGLAGLGQAHETISTKITWTREISRIVYLRCASCHHEGGKAFSLMTYEEARPWAKAIKEEVLERRMPPWNAVKGFGEFKNDVGLTQEQIQLIANWVEGGAPEGEASHAPEKPDFEPEKPLPPPGLKLDVIGALVLPKAANLVAIRAAAGVSLQAVATLPDGTVEPLIWLRKFNPTYTGIYYFKQPLKLPAGTRIQLTPQIGAKVSLYTGKSD